MREHLKNCCACYGAVYVCERWTRTWNWKEVHGIKRRLTNTIQFNRVSKFGEKSEQNTGRKSAMDRNDDCFWNGWFFCGEFRKYRWNDREIRFSAFLCMNINPIIMLMYENKLKLIQINKQKHKQMFNGMRWQLFLEI